MLDYCISEDRRSGHVNEDWFIGDKCECEPVHSRPVRELTRHNKCSTSTSCESLDESESAASRSDISTHTNGSELEFEAEEMVFEFEF